MKQVSKFSILWVFAWRNLWCYPKRSFILFLVLFLGIFTNLFFTSLMQAWGQSMLNQTYRTLGGEVFISGNVSRETQKIPTDISTDLQKLFSVSSQQKAWLNQQNFDSTGRLSLPAIIQSEYEIAPTRLSGIRLQNELGLSIIGQYYQPQKILPSCENTLFRSPFSSDSAYEIIVGQALLKQLNTEVGRRIVLMTQNTQGELKQIGLKIVDRFRTGDRESEMATVYLPILTLQNWLDLPNQLNEIAISTQRESSSSLLLTQQIAPQNLQTLIEILQQNFPNTQIKTWQQQQPFAYDSIQMMDAFNWVWLTLIGILMLLGILNTLFMMLYERRLELQNLYHLGISQFKLQGLLLLELFILSGFAFLLSILAMLLIIQTLPAGIDLTQFSEGSAWLGIERNLVLKVHWSLWLENSAQLMGSLLLISWLIIVKQVSYKSLNPSSGKRL